MFPRFDMNVALAPEFVAAVDGAFQDQTAGLVLLTANGESFVLWMLRDYLKARLRSLSPAEGRALLLIRPETTEAEMLGLLGNTTAGDLVVFDELRPQDGALEHSVIAAAQFVEKGATVLATIHGGTHEWGLSRLKQIWLTAGKSESVMPQARFIPFVGKVGFKRV